MAARLRALTAAMLIGASCTVVLSTPGIADASATGIYKNCTAFHTKYKHGAGKAGARDHVSGSTKPVTNFYHSTKVYNAAMSHNKRLDADHDGVACEAH